jgi:hypothetical protein
MLLPSYLHEESKEEVEEFHEVVWILTTLQRIHSFDESWFLSDES